MQKVKILILDDTEEQALTAVLREAMGCKKIPVAHNISYLSGKLENTPPVNIPQEYIKLSGIRDQLQLIIHANFPEPQKNEKDEGKNN